MNRPDARGTTWGRSEITRLASTKDPTLERGVASEIGQFIQNEVSHQTQAANFLESV